MVANSGYGVFLISYSRLMGRQFNISIVFSTIHVAFYGKTKSLELSTCRVYTIIYIESLEIPLLHDRPLPSYGQR